MVEKHYMMEEILPLFNTLAADDQDSVRLLAIENCRQLAKLMTEDENQATVLTLVKSCAEDKSWKVRHNVAKEFYPVCSKFHAIDRVTGAVYRVCTLTQQFVGLGAYIGRAACTVVRIYGRQRHSGAAPAIVHQTSTRPRGRGASGGGEELLRLLRPAGTV